MTSFHFPGSTFISKLSSVLNKHFQDKWLDRSTPAAAVSELLRIVWREKINSEMKELSSVLIGNVTGHGQYYNTHITCQLVSEENYFNSTLKIISTWLLTARLIKTEDDTSSSICPHTKDFRWTFVFECWGLRWWNNSADCRRIIRPSTFSDWNYPRDKIFLNPWHLLICPLPSCITSSFKLFSFSLFIRGESVVRDIF